MPMPTIDDLKTYLNITTTGSDIELSDMLDAAIDVVENIVGPLLSQSVTETHYGTLGPTVVTRRAPVLTLVSVSARWYPGMAWADQDVTGYELNADTGEIRLASGQLFRGDVKITYTVGYTALPSAISLATVIIAGQLWETQRGAMPLPANATDDMTSADVGFAPAIPDRAKTLLEPFARGPAVG